MAAIKYVSRAVHTIRLEWQEDGIQYYALIEDYRSKMSALVSARSWIAENLLYRGITDYSLKYMGCVPRTWNIQTESKSRSNWPRR